MSLTTKLPSVDSRGDSFIVPSTSSVATSAHVAPLDSTLSVSRYNVLVQLSDGGSRIIPPMNTMTLNGLTFSTSVAWGCSNQSTSV